ncbi:hypothetical protein ABIB51_004406 [Arthrobacter sp. UYCu712]
MKSQVRVYQWLSGQLVSSVGEGQASVVPLKVSQQLVLQYLAGDTRCWFPGDQEVFDVS